MQTNTTPTGIFQPGVARRIKRTILVVVTVLIVAWVATYFLLERKGSSTTIIKQTPLVITSTDGTPVPTTINLACSQYEGEAQGAPGNPFSAEGERDLNC